jgi:hypothetical protein
MLIFSANARRLIDRSVAAFVEPARCSDLAEMGRGESAEPGARRPVG